MRTFATSSFCRGTVHSIFVRGVPSGCKGLFCLTRRMKNNCWRGPPGSGKRQQIYSALGELARNRGYSFRVLTKQWALEKAKESDEPPTDEEEGSTTTAAVLAAKDHIPYETSILHFGFDIARMSLQDRHILPPIFERLGHGSHVLTGGGDHTESRILVFYHIHLLSIESILALQSVLEQDSDDIVVWCTTEHPLPLRIAHYFEERPVTSSSGDAALIRIRKTIVTAEPTSIPLFDPQMLFDRAIRLMCSPIAPTLSEVAGIRAFLYECLLRNIRWIDCVHHCLISVLRLPLKDSHRLAALRVLALQEGSAAGQTIPSYRIPIMWENFFLQMRNILSDGLIGGDVTTGAETACQADDSKAAAVETPVEKNGRVGRRPRVASRRNGGQPV